MKTCERGMGKTSGGMDHVSRLKLRLSCHGHSILGEVCKREEALPIWTDRCRLFSRKLIFFKVIVLCVSWKHVNPDVSEHGCPRGGWERYFGTASCVAVISYTDIILHPSKPKINQDDTV